MAKRKQSSLLENFRFTSKKLNLDSGGGSAANNVNAGPSSADASTCLGQSLKWGPCLIATKQPRRNSGHLQARLLVHETATGVERVLSVARNQRQKVGVFEKALRKGPGCTPCCQVD